MDASDEDENGGGHGGAIVARAMSALLLSLSLASCSATHREAIRSRTDRRLLGTAAEDYWTSVRWNDVSGAGAYLGTADERIKLAKALSEPILRITDVRVLTVEVGETKPDAAVRREGTVLVKVESYDIAGVALNSSTIEQAWTLTGRVWHVDAEHSPLTDGRPW